MKGHKIYSRAVELLGDLYSKKNLKMNQKMILYDSYVKLLRKAAYLGNADAQFELGQVYEDINYFGVNENQNPKKCVYWYTKASVNNHPEAFNNLAHYYELGKGVKKDISRAKIFYRKAAQLGSKLGKQNLLLIEGNK